MSDTTSNRTTPVYAKYVPRTHSFRACRRRDHIMFSVASFSFLYTSEGTSRDSDYGDRGFEVEPARSGGFPYIRPNRPPVSKGADPMSPRLALVLPDSARARSSVRP
jgi:hypothetical protein